MAASYASVPEKEPAAKAEVREERKEKTVRRDAAPKRPAGNSFATRLRGNRIGRFIYEAYYELRYKVTWPTFVQARNMTVVVILLSLVIGGILALADQGLYQLFLLINRR